MVELLVYFDCVDVLVEIQCPLVFAQCSYRGLLASWCFSFPCFLYGSSNVLENGLIRVLNCGLNFTAILAVAVFWKIPVKCRHNCGCEESSLLCLKFPSETIF